MGNAHFSNSLNPFRFRSTFVLLKVGLSGTNLASQSLQIQVNVRTLDLAIPADQQPSQSLQIQVNVRTSKCTPMQPSTVSIPSDSGQRSYRWWMGECRAVGVSIPSDSGQRSYARLEDIARATRSQSLQIQVNVRTNKGNT